MCPEPYPENNMELGFSNLALKAPSPRLCQNLNSYIEKILTTESLLKKRTRFGCIFGVLSIRKRVPIQMEIRKRRSITRSCLLCRHLPPQRRTTGKEDLKARGLCLLLSHIF